MAGTLSRSWSFFSSGRRQEPSPATRMNLQRRYPTSPARGESGGWQQTYTQAEGHHSLYTHPGEDHEDQQDTAPPQGNSHPSHNTRSGRGAGLPLGPLGSLPSGVRPLWASLASTRPAATSSRVWKHGGRRVTRALQGVRTSLSSLSQVFRRSTRRRYKLEGGTPTTPHHRRTTPGKLYSPFTLTTPATPLTHRGPKRLTPGATPTRRAPRGTENRGMVATPGHTQAVPSPPCHPHPSPRYPQGRESLRRDVLGVRQGLRELEQVTSAIIHHPPSHTRHTHHPRC